MVHVSWHMKLRRFQIIMGFRIYNIEFMVPRDWVYGFQIGFLGFKLNFWLSNLTVFTFSSYLVFSTETRVKI